MPETVSTPTPTPVVAAPVAKPSFILRSKLVFKKYQNVNGKGMNPVDAENEARSELGLPALTEAEIAAIQKRDSLMKKVSDNKIWATLGSLSFVKKIRAKVEGNPAVAATPAATPATPVAAAQTPAATPVAQNTQPKVGA